MFSTPVLYCISDPASGDPGRLMAAAAENGVEFFQFRHRTLPPAARRAAALGAAEVERRGTLLIINGDPELAGITQADGIHFPFRERAAAGLVSRGGVCVGISVHNAGEALEASRFDPDYLLVAPVYAPLSKAADSPALGPEGLRRVCEAVKIPVIALGGVVQEHFADVLEAGAAGVAGITLFSRHDAMSEVVRSFRAAARQSRS